MTSFLAKSHEVERKWYLVDAKGMTLGRLASAVATILRGKNKAIYTPHVDTGDYVVIINAEKIVVTGDKANQKYYKRYSGYAGGLKEIPYKDMLQKYPERIIQHAVKGMLPKNSLGREMFRKLRVYAGPEHDNQAQNPELIEL